MSTILLLYNLAAMPICKEQIFLQRGTISTGPELVIFMGFILAAIFDIASFLWLLLRVLQARPAARGDKGLLALGALCLVLMLGEKAMVDEIGREYPLGWEVLGEWIILYVFLAIQLVYNVLILRRAYRSRLARRSEAKA
ncbi:MAG: hypothetical protein PVG60_09640 [Desulfarculaceae bacterium]